MYKEFETKTSYKYLQEVITEEYIPIPGYAYDVPGAAQEELRAV